MATATFNSFLSPNYYNTEKSVSPLYAAFLAGSTFVPPTFSGVSGAASTNPGGLFGWLIYSRTSLANPTIGSTADNYIVYNNPFDLVNDLNNLSGITACIVTSTVAQGGTFGFFNSNGTEITGKTNGTDFLHAINYLAYGGTLVIAGSCSGFSSYETTTSNLIDVLIAQNNSASEAQYVENTPQVIGIFGSTGNGAGYTAQNFDSLFSSASLVSGSTVADRIFNVYGQRYQFKVPTTSLETGTTITITLPMMSDVAGAFNRSKNLNQIYYTNAGSNNSFILNGIVKNPVIWTDTTTKNLLKKNRVNFYIKNNLDYFLGLDLVGATAGSSASYTSEERVGPSKLKQDIETNVRTILLKYVFEVNNAATRSAITSEISLYLIGLSQFLDSAFTQVTCDSSNNTDNSSTINVNIVIKPLLASEEFAITLSVSA